ncbi:thiamine-phosphate kinase [Candidatus Vondammii sp. HM_W22]|uniref:thiamine-phosphate kinase n=1 Tax=Candidatus Vondammii sp. HM_W22 TaxID=2687299 RepID=UPI001F13FAC7|nr:thiamine-phosphate kinase [Candidatus Vondammii sp. HM_W22]
MALSEFDLIRNYFSRAGRVRDDVSLGIGDDCALLQVPDGFELAVSIDTLVEGVHFFPGADPESLGYKSLAVNLSDLAAMGAKPAWATLALTLPKADPLWLEAFSRGFAGLANRYGVQLIGGDTTRGPLNISVQVHGFVAPGEALRRNAASPGDLIYVTGDLGDAGLALLAEQGDSLPSGLGRDQINRLHRPEPRLAAGMAMAGIARGGIDISDGLLSDLGHICEASGVGATVELEKIPLSSAVRSYIEQLNDWSLPLAAGDDYELCVTVPSRYRGEIEAVATQLDVNLTQIGTIGAGDAVCCLRADGEELVMESRGFEHFTGGR